MVIIKPFNEGLVIIFYAKIIYQFFFKSFTFVGLGLTFIAVINLTPAATVELVTKTPCTICLQKPYLWIKPVDSGPSKARRQIETNANMPVNITK